MFDANIYSKAGAGAGSGIPQRETPDRIRGANDIDNKLNKYIHHQRVHPSRQINQSRLNAHCREETTTEYRGETSI